MDEAARKLGLAAAAGSAALLGGAFLFQALGYAPCTMCIWQRWPHALAIVAGLALLLARGPWLLALGGLAAATTAAIGVFHTGVERGWWEGPSACSGGGDALSGLSGDALLSFDDVPSLVMCDEVVWEFLSLSLASWNAILSAGLALVWFAALATALRRG